MLYDRPNQRHLEKNTQSASEYIYGCNTVAFVLRVVVNGNILYIIPVEKNRTECVNTLRKLLMSIEREEFLQLAKQKLTRTCLKNDTICVDERNLFIDMIGAEGSHDAQQMLVNLVILQPNVTDEDIGRFLIHCITLKEPLQVSQGRVYY